MTTHKQSVDDDLLAQLAESLSGDLLDPSTSMGAVSAVLLDAGLEPEQVRLRGEKFVESRLGAPAHASVSVGMARPLLRFRKMNRDQLVAQVNALRSDANTARSVDVRLHGSVPTDLDDDELVRMLEDVFGTDNDENGK